jgi:hypothetical protein
MLPCRLLAGCAWMMACLGSLLSALPVLAQEAPASAAPPAQPAPGAPAIMMGPDGRPYIRGLDGTPWPLVRGTNGLPHVILPDGRIWPLNGPPPPPPKAPAWNHAITFRSGFGYKDNVLLSATDRQENVFYTGGVDVMFMRRPTGRYLFSFFGAGDYVRYFRQTSVSNEKVAFATTQLIRDFGEGWKSGLSASYNYQNQVFDASATETNIVIGQVEGHNLGARWLLRKEIRQYRVEGDVGLARQYFRAPLDDLWQYGPRLTLGRASGQNSDLSVSYGIFRVEFDTRETIYFNGTNIFRGQEGLVFLPQTVELAWQRHWDKELHWRTVTRLGWERNTDNGSGFFNYDRFRLSAQGRYRAKTWEATAGATVAYYDYESQPASPPNPTVRTKTSFSANARVDKNIWKGLRVFGAYAHERSHANLPADEYVANTCTAGFDWRF